MELKNINNYDKKNNEKDEIDIGLKDFIDLMINNPLNKLMIIAKILNITDSSTSKKENNAVKGFTK